MKLCRFDEDRLGLVTEDALAVIDVTPALAALPALKWPLPHGDPLIAHLDELRPRIEALGLAGPRRALDTIWLDSPVVTPSKIVAAPVNYARHLDEARADKGIHFGVVPRRIDEYGLFLKAASSLVGPSHGVYLPPTDRRVDHEIELAVVIGKGGRNISRARALQHVAGYAMALDMTLRGEEDRSWRKSRDSFAVLGPWLVTADEIADPGAIDFSLVIGQQSRQVGHTRDLIFDVPKLIEYASSMYRLHAGDIIMTGTPEGVGPVAVGDVMKCTMSQVGSMTVAVHAMPYPAPSSRPFAIEERRDA
jgi:2-keto-4-pentenoate hydratase/2-oxohepta-3-ene-1,7-dioic acid hydratase in catechol pathway